MYLRFCRLVVAASSPDERDVGTRADDITSKRSKAPKIGLPFQALMLLLRSLYRV